MVDTKKTFRSVCFVLLILTVSDILRQLSSAFTDGFFVDPAWMPQGMEALAEVLSLLFLAGFVLSMVFDLAALVLFWKGSKLVEKPNASTQHILLATVLIVFTAIGVIFQLTVLFHSVELVSAILTTLIKVMLLGTLVVYVIMAKRLRREYLATK